MKATNSRRFPWIAAGLVLCLVAAVATPVLAGPHGRRGHAPGMAGGGPGSGHGPEHFMGPMFDELDLTAEQRDQVRATVRSYIDGDLGELHRNAREARHQLEQLIRDPDAEAGQVLQAAQRLSAVEEQIAVQRHQLTTEIFGLLTEEQKQKAQQLRQDRQERFEQRLEERREWRDGSRQGP